MFKTTVTFTVNTRTAIWRISGRNVVGLKAAYIRMLEYEKH